MILQGAKGQKHLTEGTASPKAERCDGETFRAVGSCGAVFEVEGDREAILDYQTTV